MGLTYRPFAEAPQVEELRHDLEAPQSKGITPISKGTRLGTAIAGAGLVALLLMGSVMAFVSLRRRE